ncbi:hypothetical protein [Corynebacterium flavescens]|uniref:hypothetical protein n=1 Tax=Corynebacterium flavescens TaxID=28028 RepID=UPI00257C4DB3|nr:MULTISPECIES: hypothetical protein [Corynebacterium]MDN6099817.1 hypothetical protein [Corynebacterium flavescens]MDN6199470.1 hypothetical protein [Corynebacterium flavescens]MDN6225716.1 hypothetical protein [Corynebacterium flavescens]MDN6235595.1 hypothetical protein [Corynebacterium flavescens]MDN6431042.1 hypothetical protein [Corynebacterium flavescens]
MSLTLSLDLSSASVAELSALLAAARAAGVQPSTKLSVEGSVLTIDVTQPETNPARQEGWEDARANTGRTGRSDRPVGETTIRSLIDLLNERLDPPRGSFGSFLDPDGNGR